MAAKKAIPLADTITRFVPKNKQRRHPITDQFQGISAAGFALRADDKGGLSVTWIEHYGAARPDNLREAAIAFRESQPSKKIGAEGAFACAKVSAVKAKSAAFKKKIRVVVAPVIGNPGHAEVRHFTDDDIELLEALASDVFLDVVRVAALNLP
ncbi:MAG TPA: hypothetical protein VK533_04535 [Sphingomonas sp.]|uniref:hypothetical protein n=1 Tax=Sphingomonas sp. TaxID=28214 RepID=UPI002CD2DC5E|nr:hypothetical protein [Sphingomonas sp.]HMI18791.1 hypothetical protein [Sphingomonas sp.]